MCVLRRSGPVGLLTAVLITATLAGCGSSSSGVPAAAGTEPAHATAMPSPAETPTPAPAPSSTPASPIPAAATAPANIYAAAGAGMLTGAAKSAKSLIYVPNGESNTVDVIDPTTYQVVDHYPVGRLPQHVVPSWDLTTLYVTNNTGNSLTPIDPTTGKPGAAIPVDDPYNMYFTPDGKYAIVVAEALQRLDFRDPHSWQLVKSVKVDCKGIDHIDFSVDGSYLIGTCEFAGKLVKLDLRTQEVLGYITTGGMPQDIKLDPTGRTFYVADMQANGLHVIDGESFAKTGFVPTGKGAHGLYPSRDASVMYVSNRGEGTISVVDFKTGQVTATWNLGSRTESPDMGGVSVDGKVLWLSGRYSSAVYAVDTATGNLIKKIPVGKGPHGLCVWPQPGRYSLGHTGILR
jgi:YVTN family beta-propeller protein